MTETITIAGQPFQAPVRYEEGHELTAGEASALNQTFHENLRNNFAKRVKDALEAGAFDAEEFQKQFDDYAQAYEFGVRTGGGGGSRDPVLTEAMNIAKAKIRDALRVKGIKLKDVDAKVITEKAKTLAMNEKIMDLARERVKERQTIAADDLESLVGDIA